MHEFTLISSKLDIKIYCILYLHFTTSTWSEIDFKKPCQHLVLPCFSCPIENTCIYTIFRNTKEQQLAPIISATHYATKNSPWIALYNAIHIGVVTAPQWQFHSDSYSLLLQHNVHSHTKSIDRFYYPGGKPRKNKLLILFKLAKLGVSVFAEWCWLWIHPYWSLTFQCTEKDAPIITYLAICKFLEQA